MAVRLPLVSPHIRHCGGNDDIFGIEIVIEADSGFAILRSDEIERVSVAERANTLTLVFKNGDVIDCLDIPSYDFNEILCWATVNKLI